MRNPCLSQELRRALLLASGCSVRIMVLAHSAPMALAPHWRAGLLRQIKACKALAIALIIPWIDPKGYINLDIKYRGVLRRSVNLVIHLK